MRLLLLACALLIAAAPALAGREVVRSYETPALPCGPLMWCAVGTIPWILDDGYLDVGLVSEPPQPSDSGVALAVRDSSGARVIALFCQDVDGHRGCDTSAGSADRVAWMCDGDLLRTAIDPAAEVHVFVPPPAARISSCGALQESTLSGTVHFAFD